MSETRISGPTTCPECRELDRAERRAERSGDHSRATDQRVLRRRHRAEAHPEGGGHDAR